MRKFLDFFEDHFITVCIVCVCIGLVLGLFTFLAFPSSAEASSAPTDLTGYTVIVPSSWSATTMYGEYNLRYDLTMIYSSGSRDFDSCLSLNIGYRMDGFDSYSSSNTVSFVYENGLTSASISQTSYSLQFYIYDGIDVTSTSLIQWFVDNNATFTKNSGGDPDEPSTATITAGTYFGVENPSTGSFNVSFSFTSDSYDFDTFYVGTDYITYRMLTGSTRTVNAFDFTSDLWAFGFESITVPVDQTLPADFVTWFNSNYSKQNTSVPGPTYTIEAGYYKARDSFTTFGWNVTNDSIRIRYYNDAANVQAYKVVDGISFLVENDAAEIYYADSAVFTDGWNIDGAKNIQVLQDITVSSGFYTVFNNVFAPSSEASNEFDSGYAAGYVDGRSDGYDIGYRQGYAEGLADGDTNIFSDIIEGTLSAVDSFTIFGGFSLLDLISTLLGGMALVWILKLLAGG